MNPIKLLSLVVTCLWAAIPCLTASEPDQPITVRVASYNVEFGKSATPEQIGAMFKPYKLDIIGFDEAPDDDWTARVGIGNRYLAERDDGTADRCWRLQQQHWRYCSDRHFEGFADRPNPRQRTTFPLTPTVAEAGVKLPRFLKSLNVQTTFLSRETSISCGLSGPA